MPNTTRTDQGLYNLSQRMKFPNCSVLSQKVINYLQKCFSYCINLNTDNPSELWKAIKTIIPYAFGTHSNCDTTWCRFHQDPVDYTHHKLPYGKDLHSQDLQVSLENIMNEYIADIADILFKKITPCLNSQRKESLNGTIGSKYLKFRHYCGSESIFVLHVVLLPTHM